jgi:hypothetical protein
MIVLTTIPKAGTHLLMGVLQNLGYAKDAPDGFRQQHAPYEGAEIEGADKHLVLIRDPRDLVVSLFHVAQTGRAGKFVAEMVRIAANDSELQALIAFGIVGRRIAQFDGWTTDPRCLTLRFEDIVPDELGGAAGRRRDTAQRLGAWLERDPQEVERAFTVGVGTNTFRRGLAGCWRDELEPRLADHISRFYPEVMQRWGYAG